MTPLTPTVIVGLIIFVSFVLLQLLYIIHPLFKARGKPNLNRELEQTKMSILIPAYNEEAVVEKCLRGILSLSYNNYEAIFINDGSTDSTLMKLRELLEAETSLDAPAGRLTYAPVINVYRSKKYPNMMLIDKMNGGKADSLNAGIDFATGDVVITLDADSVLEADSLHHINAQFKDEKVVAAGGMVHVGQMFDEKGRIQFKGKGLLKNQLADYLTSFYLRKTTQSAFNVLAIVSGAFGAFRRELLFEIGGYKKTIGEDMEITLNIQQTLNKRKYRNCRMVFIPGAVCYTEVPENLRDSFKQRTRWQKGFIDCIVKYRKSFLNGFKPKFTFFLLWDSLLLGVNGTVTAFMIPLAFIFKSFDSLLIAIYIICFTLQITSRLTAYGIAARHGFRFSGTDWVKIVLFSAIETFTYRLLDPAVFAYGSVSYFLGDRHKWNKVQRLGNVTVGQQKLGA